MVKRLFSVCLVSIALSLDVFGLRQVHANAFDIKGTVEKALEKIIAEEQARLAQEEKVRNCEAGDKIKECLELKEARLNVALLEKEFNERNNFVFSGYSISSVHVLLGMMATLVTVLAGLIGLFFAWRKDRREARVSNLKNRELELKLQEMEKKISNSS